ncbi:MAG: ribonuclease H [bacterium]|nr:MAG: ribonuclease H [bacterium]
MRNNNNVEKVEIFCDGSCLGNPGPGGWGAIIRSGQKEVELSGGKRMTTNNEMEMTAVIESLKTLASPSEAVVTTDSQYVVKGMTQWIHSWIKNGWKTANKKPVKNRGLWEEMFSLSARHEVKWSWIRGHAGHPENERCDRLAVQEAVLWK